MSSRRRPRKKPEEHHVDKRWMASSMDMVAVLMCLFIVLYAMSTVDANKFEHGVLADGQHGRGHRRAGGPG